jgi:hypothetical protein
MLKPALIIALVASPAFASGDVEPRGGSSGWPYTTYGETLGLVGTFTGSLLNFFYGSSDAPLVGQWNDATGLCGGCTAPSDYDYDRNFASWPIPGDHLARLMVLVNERD